MNKCWCGNQVLEEYSDNYYVCRNCGTLVTKKIINKEITEVKDEDHDLYGKNYWLNKMSDIAGANSIDALIQQYLGGRVLYWIKYILKYIPIDSSIAEVGCGLGQLAYLMKLLGYQQTAYEISPAICDFLTQEMGLKVICGEFGSKNEIYEAILCFDLIEHLLEPKNFALECYRSMWGRGIFCCQTPCYTEEWSYEEMLLNKPDFEHLLVPEQHIYIFSKRSISRLLRETGFTNVCFEPPAFGEHYDMFLFASNKAIEPLNQEEIQKKLMSKECGRLIRVLIDFFNRLNQ